MGTYFYLVVSLKIFLLSFGLSAGECLQQPVVTRLSPPSGAVGEDLLRSSLFTITGQFLTNTTVVVGNEEFGTTPFSRNDSSISFYIGPPQVTTIQSTVIVVEPNEMNCSAISLPVTLFPQVRPGYPSLSTLEAQPGTVIFMNQGSCLPGECGDNSTSFTVTVSGVPLETLDTQNTSLKYAGRVPNFQNRSEVKELVFVTEYQLFRMPGFLSYDLLPPGTISSVSPSAGQRGTRVTIEGTRLRGLDLNVAVFSVQLGANTAEIIDASSDSQIIVRAGTGLPIGNGSIRINSTQTFDSRVYDGPYTYAENVWTQLQDGVVTSIIPSAAQEGRDILICGTDILGGGNSVSGVQLRSTSFRVLSAVADLPPFNITEPECIQAQVGNLSSISSGILNVTSDTGAYVESRDTFTIASVDSISPSRGQAGTIVTVRGQGLLSGTNSGVFYASLSEVPAIVVRSSSTEVVLRAGEPLIRRPTVINATTGATESPPQVYGVPGGVSLVVQNPYSDNDFFNVTTTSGWQLEESGIVNFTEPQFGQVGTLITISGTNLLAYGSRLTHVTIGGVNATEINSANNTVVQVTTPVLPSVGRVDIILFSDTGASIRAPLAFEYRESGLVTDVFPAEGQNGTFVTITGENLLGYGQNISSILFGNVPATIDYSTLNDTSIEVRLQANNNTNAEMVSITIISDTFAVVRSIRPIWTFLIPGEIINNSPRIGQAGTRIQITGTNLLGGGTEISEAFVDGIAAVVGSASDTSVTLIPGDLRTQRVNFYPGQIFIQSDTGSVVIGGNYTHQESGVISTFAPTRGRGGTVVTITGTNLFGFGIRLDQIQLAGITVREVEFANATNIVVQADFSNAAVSGPIVLTVNTGAVITSSSNFTYDEPGEVSMVDPGSGAEGTGVSLSGSGLLPSNVELMSITVGGIPVSRIVTTSSTEISVILGPAPSDNPNMAEIIITANDGSFVNNIFFSFMNFDLLLPDTILGREGTLLNVLLPNAPQFAPSLNLRVTVDDQSADIVNLDANQRIVTVRVPRARSHGAYTADVAVEGLNGLVARLRNAFTYISGGLICDVEPAVGQMGTRVTLRGENFLGGSRTLTSVEIVGQQAILISSTNTTATIQLPEIDSSSLLPLTGDVVLTAESGAVLRRLNGFTLTIPGRITMVSPQSGQNGTTVNIQGTNLLQGNLQILSVTLAGIPAVVMGTPSNTNITVQAGPSAVPSGSLQDVVVTLSTGAILRSLATFEYLAPGSITSVTPESGTVGTRISIVGTNLLQGGGTLSQVLLKGIPAGIRSSSNTSIMIVAQSDIAGVGDVVIISDTGATLTGVGRWTYEDLGEILTVTPEISQQGGTILITGMSLLGSAGSIVQCSLAGVVGRVVPSPTDNSVQCVAGDVPFRRMETTGFVQLVTDTGVVLDSSRNNVTFTYYAASIDSVSPSQGNNGTTVRITGINLIGSPDSSLVRVMVRLGSLFARIISSSQNEIIVTASLSSLPIANNTLRVETGSGVFLELPRAWDYTDPGRIMSVSPQFGFPGTMVELTGETLFPSGEAPYRVIVGQTAAFDVNVIDITSATFRAGIYDGSDLPEEELPIQVISSTGRTVSTTSVTFYYNQTLATLTSVTPSAGSEGSRIVISGEDLPEASDITRITLAGVDASIVSSDENAIVVMAGRPPSAGASGPVIIETSEFLLSMGGSVWTYFPTLTSTSVSPNSGQNGTEVRIDLSTIDPYPPIERIELNDVRAEIVAQNNSILTVYAGLSGQVLAGILGDITLSLSGNIVITIFDSWMYQLPVSVTQLSPSSGYFGTFVNITGEMFQANSGRVSEVYLSGMSTDIQMQSNTVLQVRISEVQANSTQDVVGPVVIIADDRATFTSTSPFMFTFLGVNITEVSPTNGTRGTLVTLRGDNLLAGGNNITSVTVAGINALDIQEYNSTSIKFVAGPSPIRINESDIVYTMDTGAVVTVPNSWTYLDPGQVTLVTPSAGELGTVVSITGSGLFGGGTRAEYVYLNSVMATEIIRNFDNFIQVRAQAGTGSLSPGSVMIVSDTGAVSESPSDIQFAYLAPARFSSINPASGQNGTIVTVTGTGFHNGEGIARVFLAGTEAAIIAIQGSSITVEAGRPSSLESITGPVVVQSTLNTTSISSQPFRYLQEGVILSVTPDRGRNNTICLISGENLYGGGSMLRSVILDGIAALILNQSSSTAFVRAGLPFSVNGSIGSIILISNTNSYVTRIDGWTTVPQGTIDSISPQNGQFGTRITISGQNLLSGGSSLSRLLLDDIELFDISFTSDTFIIARVGQPELGYSFLSESVTLVSNFNSELYLEYTWGFLNQSNITELYPPTGFSGTVVNITGTNLLGGGSQITSATIGSIPATVVSSSDELVVIVTGENGGGMEMQGTLVLESDTGALSVSEWQYERECPNNTFGMVGNCTECDQQCATCIGPSSSNCTSCANFAILTNTSDTGMICVNSCPGLSTLDNVCVDSCDSNQFEQINTELNLTFCLNCSDLCDPNLGCSGPATTQCTSCQFFLDVVNQNCTERCPSDQFYVNETKECRPCHEQCSGGCYGPTEFDCNSCREFTTFVPLSLTRGLSNTACRSTCSGPYFLDAQNCIPCDSNCRDGCTDASPFSCTNCEGPFFEFPNGTQKCVADCGTSYYSDQSNRCLPCSDLCLSNSTCRGPSSEECATCSLSHNGDCVPECPTTHYANDLTLLCEECDPSCSRGCVGTSQNCITAQGAFVAGGGTIGVVIVIIIVLVVIIVLLVILLIWFLRLGGKGGRKFSFPTSYDSKDRNDIDIVRYSQRTQVQDISEPSKDIPMGRIETEKHVQNPIFDNEAEHDVDSKDWTLRKKKAEFVRTKGEEDSVPEKDEYVAVDVQFVQESSMDDEKATLLAKESSLPQKNQPISASQDLYMEMDGTAPEVSVSPDSGGDSQKPEQAKRQSVVVENPAAGSPYIKMTSASVQRQSLIENQETIETEEKKYQYSKIRKETSLPEKNQLITGSQDLYTEMESPQGYPMIEEISASQDVYTDMDLGPPSLPARDTPAPAVPAIPPKPALKPPISVPPKEATISETSEKPPIPSKSEKPPPPGPPVEPSEVYTEMDGGITEVFMNPIAEDTYDDVSNFAPGTSPTPVEDSLYEDTENSDFIADYRKSKRDMKLPEVPESRGGKMSKIDSAPALPSAPIPKKKTSIPLPITPLQKSLSSASMPNNPTSPISPEPRPMSITSLPEEESLYDDIPGAGMSEQLVPPTPSRNPPAKSKPTKKQQSKGKQMKK